MPTGAPLPTSLLAFQAAFSTEAACRAHLLSLRSGMTFRCPGCGWTRAWEVRTRGMLTCAKCRKQVSPTSGTALDRSRLPLTVIFVTAYLLSTTPGLNAKTLAVQLGISRRETAWLLLAKMRRAMATTLTEPLTGVVEADEAWFGGPQDAEKRARWGKSALMVLALAEARPGGRCRLVRVNDNTAKTLTAAIASVVEPGATLRTDGWRAYMSLTTSGFAHDRRTHPPGWTKSQNRSTPYADEVISASKRWLVQTYQKPAREHLPSYLAEFAFRREFRDLSVRFDMLLRALMAAPPRTARAMAGAADLPPVPGTLPPPKPRKVPKRTKRPAMWNAKKPTPTPAAPRAPRLVAPATP